MNLNWGCTWTHVPRLLGHRGWQDMVLTLFLYWKCFYHKNNRHFNWSFVQSSQIHEAGFSQNSYQLSRIFSDLTPPLLKLISTRKWQNICVKTKLLNELWFKQIRGRCVTHLNSNTFRVLMLWVLTLAREGNNITFEFSSASSGSSTIKNDKIQSNQYFSAHKIERYVQQFHSTHC